MKNKQFVGVGILAVAAMMLPATLLAEILHGKIYAVDPKNQSFHMERTGNVAGGGIEKLNISVPNSATLKGVTSLDELKPGDEVMVDASKGLFGPWKAKALERHGAMSGQAAAQD